jgi:hypothetical protein|tara:strand:- start:58 stop:168 length:111 start_codon:yes stop_codon:yes gene_type:complete
MLDIKELFPIPVCIAENKNIDTAWKWYKSETYLRSN